ncbi:lysophospholipid acyltransferase family protein [Bordetella holmesii]|uniref:Lipid A biosynthesis (KDO)2-(Lauroyl)-lipid IVA acyltransferase n=3 Tax=Bordetella holmesii TaxID=35814 RepID=A0A158M099_9BORD|nr:lipid A biosynthesis lauroyl acyltransferase [Bordetella holmesii H558]AOB37119.1 lipid A biosynthesis lauroyl acyltransferase [Bordetella holmesii]KAK77511.1 lipid A biosynthesis (KDO)2-(lauroyl)-lipid IVA acyltransferase [Bordetella holmesii CDC-H809-BH]KAK85560.1 lipid A biosynthesis (KDO)2-(lauroyl)-lipid IVA acyltransferase [Bordetella holmesii H620]KAK86011.1 lipid A biosynthesis (KDO)2-(lauroyl)-lipid IVA acyltransferase [Bordetella holmesii CDC-H572-BH]KAK87434.1 lipid A biosynthesi
MSGRKPALKLNEARCAPDLPGKKGIWARRFSGFEAAQAATSLRKLSVNSATSGILGENGYPGEATLLAVAFLRTDPRACRAVFDNDYMLLAFFRFIALLPLPVLQAFGRSLGKLAYAWPGKYRQRLKANAAQAGYPQAAFARRAAGQIGASMLESPWIWFREKDSLNRIHLDEANRAVLETTLAEQRGTVFLTPHLGCFEVMARYLAQKVALTVMFRPPRKAILAPLLETARNNSAVRAVPANMQGVREFVRALRRGEAVGLLPDQAPGQGEGVWAPFFGRMAYTVTLPGKLAGQTRVPIVLCAAQRLPRGQGWQLHFVRVPEPLPDDPQAQATLLNHSMEALIRRCPDQYLWGYNRYKTPRGAPPAPTAP